MFGSVVERIEVAAHATTRTLVAHLTSLAVFVVVLIGDIARIAIIIAATARTIIAIVVTAAVGAARTIIVIAIVIVVTV